MRVADYSIEGELPLSVLRLFSWKMIHSVNAEITSDLRCHSVKCPPLPQKSILSLYDLDLRSQTLKTFSVISTHTMIVCGKFHWNPSTKYKDIASCELGINLLSAALPSVWVERSARNYLGSSSIAAASVVKHSISRLNIQSQFITVLQLKTGNSELHVNETRQRISVLSKRRRMPLVEMFRFVVNRCPIRRRFLVEKTITFDLLGGDRYHRHPNFCEISQHTVQDTEQCQSSQYTAFLYAVYCRLRPLLHYRCFLFSAAL